MTEGKVKANNIDIRYQDFGNPSNPAALKHIG